MDNTPITAWMWQDGFFTRGANLELADGIIEWQMDIAFKCSTETAKQPIAGFLAHGTDRCVSVPDDIIEEIRHSLDQLTVKPS
jgi:hypothetical protein